MPETTTERRRERRPSLLDALAGTQRGAALAQYTSGPTGSPAPGASYGPAMAGGYSTFTQPMAPTPAAPGGFSANPGGNMTDLGARMRQLGPVAPAVDPRVSYVPRSGEVRGKLTAKQTLMAIADRNPDSQFVQRLPDNHPAKQLAAETIAARTPTIPGLPAVMPPQVAGAGQFNLPVGVTSGLSASTASPPMGATTVAGGQFNIPAAGAQVPTSIPSAPAGMPLNPMEARRQQYAQMRVAADAQRARIATEAVTKAKARAELLAADPRRQAVMQNAQFGRQGGAMLRALGGAGPAPNPLVAQYLLGPEAAQTMLRQQQMMLQQPLQQAQTDQARAQADALRFQMTQAERDAARAEEDRKKGIINNPTAADIEDNRRLAMQHDAAGNFSPELKRAIDQDYQSGGMWNLTNDPLTRARIVKQLVGKGWSPKHVGQWLVEKFGAGLLGG